MHLSTKPNFVECWQ